jgi:hypothetical protein
MSHCYLSYMSCECSLFSLLFPSSKEKEIKMKPNFFSRKMDTPRDRKKVVSRGLFQPAISRRRRNAGECFFPLLNHLTFSGQLLSLVTSHRRFIIVSCRIFTDEHILLAMMECLLKCVTQALVYPWCIHIRRWWYFGMQPRLKFCFVFRFFPSILSVLSIHLLSKFLCLVLLLFFFLSGW